jgi:hypothetical protein
VGVYLSIHRLLSLVDHVAHVVEHGEQVVAQEQVPARAKDDLLRGLVLRLEQVVPLRGLVRTTCWKVYEYINAMIQTDEITKSVRRDMKLTMLRLSTPFALFWSSNRVARS